MKSITLKQIKKVVNESLKKKRIVDLLKEEASKSFGMSIFSDQPLGFLAEQINDKLDVYERTGRVHEGNVKPSLLLKFCNHKNDEVRKLVARLLPVSLAESFKDDSSDIVRHAVAKRIRLSEVRKMCKKFPYDDELRSIFRERKLNEVVEKDVPYNNTIKQSYFDSELSDEWYEKKARLFVMDYGSRYHSENLWKNPAVLNFCNAVKTTSRFEVDESKLISFIDKVLEEESKNYE